jgi:hypothetical protein
VIFTRANLPTVPLVALCIKGWHTPAVSSELPKASLIKPKPIRIVNGGCAGDLAGPCLCPRSAQCYFRGGKGGPSVCVWLLIPSGTELKYVYRISCGPGNVVGIATGYGLDGPGIESRWGRDFPHLSRPAPGPHPASCTMGTGSFPGVKSDRGVTLTPHPL